MLYNALQVKHKSSVSKESKLPSALAELTKDTVEALQLVRYRKGEQYSSVLKFDRMGYKLK